AEILIKKGTNDLFITPGVGKIKGYSQVNGVPVYRLHSILNYLLDVLFSISKKSTVKKTVIEYNDSLPHNTIDRRIGLGSRLRYLVFLINAYLFIKKRKSNISILHCHTIEWPAYVAAKLSKWFKIKLIVKDSTMNGIFNILRFPSGRKKQELIIRQSHFVAMTTIIKTNLLHAGVPENKIVMIPNGILLDDSCKNDYSGAENVLFVGNLYQQPAKGVDILIKAWKIVIMAVPQAKLSIAGDGNLSAYRQYVKEHNIQSSVIFLGKHNNVHELMLNTDIFVLPSRREGMPNVLMEAMLTGVPCIGTSISGSQDLLEGGECGIIVPPSDIQQLAGAIIYLLEKRDVAAVMGRNARKRIIASYNINDIADRYANLYSK
ncbi:MAG TPA: glycosyltransferase family 4 protein, partial [Flavitalea sp.]|nr:glycosyltransferase family 4 protein [Flavitalea sp.]